MSCNSTEQLFERYLDDAVSGSERARVVSHIEQCANCRGLLEELHAVDALLLAPRRIELAPNFTFATMAEARAMPSPQAQGTPIRAYVVCYLAAAWLLVAAAYGLAPQTLFVVARSLLEIARSIANAVGGLATVVAHTLGHGGSSVTAILVTLLVLDTILVLMFGAALKYIRPQWAQRLRS